MRILRIVLKTQTNITLLVLSVLGEVLIVLQLLWPSIAFAAPAQAQDFGKDRALDQAGVAVVRVAVTYTNPGGVNSLGGSFQCTGLGVLLESWTPLGATDMNNWVLTDGTLLNPTTASCAAGAPKAQLSSIQVLLNTAYSTNASL